MERLLAIDIDGGLDKVGGWCLFIVLARCTAVMIGKHLLSIYLATGNGYSIDDGIDGRMNV